MKHLELTKRKFVDRLNVFWSKTEVDRAAAWAGGRDRNAVPRCGMVCPMKVPVLEVWSQNGNVGKW